MLSAFVSEPKQEFLGIIGHATTTLTAHPDETWMAQVARNLTLADTGFLHHMNATEFFPPRHHLVHRPAPRYGPSGHSPFPNDRLCVAKRSLVDKDVLAPE